MTSWLRSKREPIKPIVPTYLFSTGLDLVCSFIGYVHSVKCDTELLNHMIHRNSLFITINTWNDKYEFNNRQHYLQFFQKYYRELREYKWADINEINIKETKHEKNKSTFDVNVKGLIHVKDKRFNYYKLCQLSEKFTITVAEKPNGEWIIINLCSTSSVMFIKYDFEKIIPQSTTGGFKTN